MASAKFFLITFFLITCASQLSSTTLSNKPTSHNLVSTPLPNSVQINSNSVLVALLDSHYTEFAELVEKALLLQTLEDAVNKYNITIFAPKNEALERNLDPEFKRFLLEPGNIKSLQALLLHHILPVKFVAEKNKQHPIKLTESTRRKALSNDFVEISSTPNGTVFLGPLKVVHPNSVVRPDGIIHGIEKVLMPRSVEHEFNVRRSLGSISAIKPESAPNVDPRIIKSKKNLQSSPAAVGSPPSISIYDAMAPGPSLAPAPAPGPGGPHHHFDGEAQVKDFINTLLHYGGYNEMADILVNLTNLANEMGRLVSEGYVLTVLAPNDEAMAKLTTEQLSEPGAPEQIVYYHIVPEYQTEESMYNAVRRFGKIKYDTLRVPHQLMAREADGSVKFGDSEETAAYLFDPDIYTDGRISVQGIDGVLFPHTQEKKEKQQVKTVTGNARIVLGKPRRGKLLEIACRLMGSFGQESRFTRCHSDSV